MCRGIFRLPWREKPGAHCDANVEEETGNERDWERKKKDQPEGSIASFFSFPLLVRIDLAKNKPGRTPLRSRCIHRWPNRPKCHIRCGSHYPTCVYLCGNRAAVCQKQRVCRCFLPTEQGRQNTTALTDWRVRLRQTNGWILCRFHA